MKTKKQIHKSNNYKNKVIKKETKKVTKKKYKIFDLSKKYEYKKGNLQNNLIQFEKEFGNKFKIKYNNHLLDMILEKSKLPNGVEFYRMIYDIPHRTTYLTPIIICFFDINTVEKNNNSYIFNIQKTDNLSGTDLVKISLEINKILGAEKTSLGDGSKVKCNITNENLDLSLLKLIERDKTFYMNLGFEFEIDNNDVFPFWRWNNKDKFMNEINRILSNIRNIKTSDLIKEYEATLDLINKIIKDNYKHKLDILYYNSNPTRNDEVYLDNPKYKIIEIFDESIKVLEILHQYSNENKFYKILVKLFKDKCDKYLTLHRFIIDNSRTQIIYNNKKIKRQYVDDFEKLFVYRFDYRYSYTF